MMVGCRALSTSRESVLDLGGERVGLVVTELDELIPIEEVKGLIVKFDANIAPGTNGRALVGFGIADVVRPCDGFPKYVDLRCKEQ